MSSSLAAWSGLVEADPLVLGILVFALVGAAAAYTCGRLLHRRRLNASRPARTR